MKVTKKTRLLAKPVKLKVNISNLQALDVGYDQAGVNFYVENPEGISGYSADELGERIDGMVSINGGEPQLYPFDKSPFSPCFDEIVSNLHAGDTVKVTVQIDPAKTGEYEAGTMELTTTVVSNI